MFELKNRVAVVTGARRGIGRAIALALARQGARVAVTDIDEKDCQSVVREIKKLGSDGIACKVDVTNIKEIEKMVKETINKFGRIDILVNNAGVCWTKEITEMKEEDWDKLLTINLKSVFLCSKAVLPTMIKQKSGKIINISSIAGPSVAWPRLCHYSASKAGIVGFTKNLAFDVGQYGINVNAVAPGAVETDMMDQVLKELGMTREQVIQLTPLRRINEPEDIAGVVAFLSSDEARSITGQVIVADGGYTIQ